MNTLIGIGIVFIAMWLFIAFTMIAMIAFFDIILRSIYKTNIQHCTKDVAVTETEENDDIKSLTAVYVQLLFWPYNYFRYGKVSPTLGL